MNSHAIEVGEIPGHSKGRESLEKAWDSLRNRAENLGRPGQLEATAHGTTEESATQRMNSKDQQIVPTEYKWVLSSKCR